MSARAVDAALLRRIAAPVAELALDFARRREMLSVEEKAKTQFVSEADRAVEAAIRNLLYAELGDVAILGEEEGGGLDPSGTGWVLDPIDGTSNFLRGLPLWGVSIGYMEQDEPVAGAILLPELGETLVAMAGGGLERNGAAFVPTPPNAVQLIALGENDFEPGAETDARAQALRDDHVSVARYNCAVFGLAGSVLGWLDGYVERGCRLWDIAAGAVICREAGLSVTMHEIVSDRWAIDVRRV